MSLRFEWILWTIGALIGAIAIVVLYWSLFHDRSRGRRRCPYCWYDMSGTPGLACSECGRHLKRERSQYKTRRNWKGVIVAIIIGMVSGGFIAAPKATRDGWSSLMPTTVLLLGLPWFESGADDGGWRGQAVDELVEYRFGVSSKPLNRQPWDWQWRMILNRAIAARQQRAIDKQYKPIDYKYSKIIGEAVDRGVVHRLDLVDQVVRTFPPSLWLRFPKTWPVNVQVQFEVHAHCPLFGRALTSKPRASMERRNTKRRRRICRLT